MAEDEEKQPIIIKKVKKVEGGHHGGAWKVAYADFVTAMMAFFLLLWLLNVTTDEQKNAISNYFDPTHPKISRMKSGSGGILAGSSLAKSGAMSSNQQPFVQQQPKSVQEGSRSNRRGEDGKNSRQSAREKFEALLKQQEDKRFQETAQKIKQAIQSSPELAELMKNLLIDVTSEGLRIQIVDQEGDPMFPIGSARMFDKTQNLMGKVGDIVRSLPNEISIRGHTDSIPYRQGADYTNWELSADRANSSRRALQETGIAAERLSDIQGKADTEHLFPEDPTDARNRRISIVLRNQDFSDVELPPSLAKKLEENLPKRENNPDLSPQETQEYRAIEEEVEQLYQKTPGTVEFP